MPGELGQLPAVLAADRGEQAPHIVPHPAPQVGTAKPVADAEEEVVEFSFPGRVRMFVDHVGRLSVSQPSHFPDPLVGGAVRQDRP